MSGKILRSALFGYKKKDVISYVENLDEKAEQRIKEKEAEASALKAEIALMKGELDEARKNRDAIVSVLEIAQKHAKEIVDNAHANADEIVKIARENAEKEKSNLNREIEIKKRDINNHILTESKKISALKKEIEELRQNSIRSIRKFEQDLGSIEATLSKKEDVVKYDNSDQTFEKSKFADVKKTVPIRVIKSVKDDKEEKAAADEI